MRLNVHLKNITKHSGSLQLNYIYNKDFISVVGDNGWGKTTLVEVLLLSKIPKEQIFILNSSHENSWYNYAPKENITKPLIFTQQYLEQFLLNFAGSHKNCLLVLDDIDNFEIKKSWVLKSIVTNARHMNLGLIVTTRNLQDIPKVLYRQSRYTFIARQISMYDRNYIATIIGLENSYKLSNLNKFDFAIFDGMTKNLDVIRLKV